MIPRFGEPVKPGQRYIRRPGAYAVLARGTSVLLTHQARPNPEFQLPGGGIDPGEDAIGALHREVWEETGWKISSPRRIGTYRRFTYMAEYGIWAEKICHVYLARPTRQISDPVEDAHSAHWLAASDALGLLESSGDRHFLSRIFGLGHRLR